MSLVAHAKTMRRTATPAERRLWQALRKHQLGGLKFRRQVPLGPFIADFYCPAVRLVVEVDGVSHIGSPNDENRDAWMSEQGIGVLRLSSLDVFRNLEGVLIAMQRAAQPTPPPQPPPARGGGAVTPQLN
jgi:very-short-patch-repair endonuclease